MTNEKMTNEEMTVIKTKVDGDNTSAENTTQKNSTTQKVDKKTNTKDGNNKNTAKDTKKTAEEKKTAETKKEKKQSKLKPAKKDTTKENTKTVNEKKTTDKVDSKKTVEEKKTNAQAEITEMFPKEFSVNGVKFTKLEVFKPYEKSIIDAFELVKNNQNLKLILAEFWDAELIDTYYRASRKIDAYTLLDKDSIPSVFPKDLDLYSVDYVNARSGAITAHSLYTDTNLVYNLKDFKNLMKNKNYFCVKNTEIYFYIADFSEVENKEYLELRK